MGLRVVVMAAYGVDRALRCSQGTCILTLCGVCPQEPLLHVQEVLNGTEVNLQHLTALVDCRSLHLVRMGLLEPGSAPAGGERLGAGHGGRSGKEVISGWWILSPASSRVARPLWAGPRPPMLSHHASPSLPASGLRAGPDGLLL